MKVIYSVKLNVSEKNVLKSLILKQNDSNSRFIDCAFMHGRFMLLVRTGTVVLNVTREDGQHKSFAGTINDNGTVRIPVANWMVENAGMLDCDVSVFDGDEKLTSALFSAEVQASANPNGSVSPDDPAVDMAIVLIDRAEAAAAEAKSWAVGDTGTREGEDIDNAMYYKQLAEQAVQGGIIDPTFLTWLTGHMSEFLSTISGTTDEWLEDNITNPSNPPLDTSFTLSNAAAPANLASKKAFVAENLFGTRSAMYLKTDGTLYTSGYKRTFPASKGDTLLVSGRNWIATVPLYILLLNGNVVGYASGLTGSTIYNNLEVNVTVDCDTIVVNGTNYSQISVYKKNLIPYTTKTEDKTQPFVFTDLFAYEDTFVDDFYPRTHVSDSDHPWTMIYNADTLVEPPMSVGTGIRDQARATELYMVRKFDTFPHVVAIGNSGIIAAIAMYANDYSDNTMFTVNGSNGQIKYGDNSIGYVNKDSKYYILDIEQTKVRVYDDVGLYIDIPISYDTSKPMNAGLYFGTGSAARYGVSSWVELKKRDLIPMNIDKVVTYPSYGNHLSYGHQTTAGSQSYSSVEDNPWMSFVNPSGISNNTAISCEIDKSDDNGFRTEMTFKGHRTFGSIYRKPGELQRFRFSACYMMPSDNLNGGYRTYIFQIHDGNFSLSGWVDAPPVHLFEKDGKLYAVLSYIDDGDIPASDNRHTTEEYYLCDFPRDTWIKVDLEIRIAWKAGMCPLLRIVVDDVERLNADLPVGYNIVSSGGYTYVKAGAYCPQWKTNTFENMKRNVIVANMKYED